jgi:CheY-like chemotaxis protein
VTRRPRILLIDDHHDTLDMIEIFLFQDYDILTALNGFEGLTLAKEQEPDCIITDIMMPVMDGIKLFNALRKNESTAGIPVIAMTSFSKEANLKSLRNLGFTEVLVKPFNRDEILEAVSKALSR